MFLKLEGKIKTQKGASGPPSGIKKPVKRTPKKIQVSGVKLVTSDVLYR